MLDTIVKPGCDFYFTADASNGYWAVPMKESDCNKTGFVTPNGSRVYLRMGQGLKGCCSYLLPRVSDLRQWCDSCHACQLTAKKLIKSGIQPIQLFKPMAMIGIDWLGPISQPCSINGHHYILILIDYFSRFIWAKSYATHTADDFLDMYENHLTHVFGHPAAAYSDNGSHFGMKKYPGILKRGVLPTFLHR